MTVVYKQRCNMTYRKSSVQMHFVLHVKTFIAGYVSDILRCIMMHYGYPYNAQASNRGQVR